MPQIVVLPHVELCPEGAVIDAVPGKSICDNLLDNGIEIEHACEKSCACTTCHVIVREGFDALTPSEEDEDDLLDKAWGLEPASRSVMSGDGAGRAGSGRRDPALLDQSREGKSLTGGSSHEVDRYARHRDGPD